MDVQVQPEASKRKKNVTTACINCRKRKAKCDGRLPSCMSCLVYEQECVYDYASDKRRLPLKTVVESLSARVQLLEDTLRENGLDVPSADASPAARQSSPNAASGGLGDPADASKWSFEDTSLNTQGEVMPSTTIGGYEGSLWEFQPAAVDPFFDESLLPPDTLGGLPKLQEPSPDSARYEETTSQPQEYDPVVEQLSRRMGSLQVAEDGQLRYFGATSNLHILHSGPSSLSRTSIRREYDPQAVLKKAGLDGDVDEELEDHLIKLYLAWEDPAVHVVTEEIFLRERAKCKEGGHSPFYSEVLTNAICSLGAAFTPRMLPNIPEPATEFFASRAHALLDIEMDCPTVATVQALVIMSGIEASLTRDARGWLYSGMAMRLAIDLGLQLNASQLVATGALTQEEADVRCITFWGCYVLDRLWGFYVGRPNMFNDKDITAPLPPSAPRSAAFWYPYIDKDVETAPSPYIPDLTNESTREAVSLCILMGQINHALYMDSETSLTALQTYVDSMRHQLAAWLEGLPQCLKLAEGLPYALPPHVLQLHMQYYEAVIYLNRPFFPKDVIRPGDENYHRQVQAGRACTMAASSISKLLNDFRRLYTLRRANIQLVHIVFTAALIHTFNISRVSESGLKRTQDDLQICCRALGDLGQTFGNASRALEVIICIKREWQNRTVSRSNTTRKRGIPSTEDGFDEQGPGRKRYEAAADYKQAIGDVDIQTFLDSNVNQDVNAWASNDFWLHSLFDMVSS